MISPTRRLLSFEADHQSGSGAWGSTNVFDCAGGQVRTIFADTFLYGASVIQPAEKPAVQEDSKSVSRSTSPDDLVLLAGHWTDKDARCCPSLEELLTYQWSETLQNYMLTGVHYRATKR